MGKLSFTDEDGEKEADVELDLTGEEGDGDEGDEHHVDRNMETEERDALNLELDGLVLLTGSMTGVAIVYTGNVTRTSEGSRKMSARLKQARPADGGNSPCDINDSEDEVTTDEFSITYLECTEDLRYIIFGSSLVCRKCGHSFDTEAKVIQQGIACRDHESSTIAVDCATRFLYSLIDKDQITVVTRTQENPLMKNVVVSGQVRGSNRFEPYWARRRKKGFSLGRNFIEPFQYDIKIMV